MEYRPDRESGRSKGTRFRPLGHLQTSNPYLRDWSHRSKVKHKKVLKRVYKPGRLSMAWQQVRKNGGAAGSRFTAERSASPRTPSGSGNGCPASDYLNYLCSVVSRGAVYLAGAKRSVGRGWPPKAIFPTRIFTSMTCPYPSCSCSCASLSCISATSAFTSDTPGPSSSPYGLWE